MSDFRDIQHGVNDPVGGLDVKRRINDNRTPQHNADVRADATPTPAEPFLPERLRRKATDPINPRTGRKPAD